MVNLKTEKERRRFVVNYYYDVYGTILLNKEVFEKEKGAILAPIMEYGPDSYSDSQFEIFSVNSKYLSIVFNGADSYGPNTYSGILEPLVRRMRALKEKYPNDVFGKVLVIDLHKEYEAHMLDLNGQTFVYKTLQEDKIPF